MNDSRKPVHIAWILIPIMLFGAGAIFGYVVAFQPRDSVPAKVDGGGTYPLTAEPFDDAQTVAVSLESVNPVSVQSDRAGVVTRYSCTVGEAARSGESLVQVDGVDLVSLYSAVPFYRDLQIGDSGADVAALQEELVALGYGTEADGTYGSETVNALNALRSHLALPGQSAFIRSDYVWLPVRELTLGKCPLKLGDSLVSGSAIAASLPTISAVTIPIPSDSDGEQWIVELGDARIEVPESGVLSDPESLALIARQSIISNQLISADAEAAGDESGVISVNGTVRLSDPVDAFAVPPSAIVTTAGAAGCVVGSSDGAPLPVKIVDSSLGMTYIRFDSGDDAPESIQINPRDDVSC